MIKLDTDTGILIWIRYLPLSIQIYPHESHFDRAITVKNTIYLLSIWVTNFKFQLVSRLIIFTIHMLWGCFPFWSLPYPIKLKAWSKFQSLCVTRSTFLIASRNETRDNCHGQFVMERGLVQVLQEFNARLEHQLWFCYYNYLSMLINWFFKQLVHCNVVYISTAMDLLNMHKSKDAHEKNLSRVDQSWNKWTNGQSWVWEVESLIFVGNLRSCYIYTPNLPA